MEKRVRELTERDIRFLKNLDSQLRSTHQSEFAPNLLGSSFLVPVDDYTDRQITEREMKKIFGISRKYNVAFYPINTDMGFSVGFDLTRIDLFAAGAPPYIELLLRFREKQLPKGYDFEKLSNFFMQEMNLGNANLLGEKIVNERAHYDY
ncbi:hypothetical protein HYT25_03680 [Candidatus Pacearchaeota archaeon]|nr:hypothetical protein [Candidatus Pacearchaeota archaeon]